MREYYSDIVRNTAGDVVEGATVTVYLAGTLTVATIYETSTDVIAVANVTTDSNGKFTFYISYSDYSPAQLFDITIVKGAANQTYEDVRIFGHGILVSGNDSTPGFLNGKLVAGNGISLTEGTDGGNETLTLALAANKIGSFTRAMDAVTADVAYTGIGFKPSAIIFLGSVVTAGISIGFDNGSDSLSIAHYEASTFDYGTAKAIYVVEAAGKYQTANVKSFDNDGFTLTWTRTGATASANAFIRYFAFR